MDRSSATRGDDVTGPDLPGALRHRWWVVLLVTLVTAGTAVGVSLLQEPVYTAETEVVISQVRRTEDVSLEELVASNVVVQTQRQVVTSRSVTERVIERLDLRTTPRELVEQVTVTAVADTKVLRIEASDPDPRAAASLADAYAEAYLDFRRDQAVEDLRAAQGALGERIQEIRQEVGRLESEIEEAEGGDRAALVAERDALLAELQQLTGRGPAAADARESIRGGGSVLSPAEVPEEPTSPRPVRNGLLATMLGLMLGAGLAVLLDNLDDVIRDESDLQRATESLPVLGRVPHWDGADDGGVVSLEDSTTGAAEAYRELGLNVRFLLAGGDPTGAGSGAVTVTSPAPQDGKTVTACNLAVAMARSGMSVVLIDADLRQPTVAEQLRRSQSPGLSDLLVAGPDAPLESRLGSVGSNGDGEGGLWVLTAGSLPPNPAELLASPAMEAIHRRLLARVDVVIYDSPPVLGVADALELARRCARTLVVARADKTTRGELEQCLERVRNVGGQVAGSVFNDLDRRAGRYGYGYYDQYQRPAGLPTSTGNGPPRSWVAQTRPLPGAPETDGSSVAQEVSGADGPLFRQ